MVYGAEVVEKIKAPNGATDAWLRVVHDNGKDSEKDAEKSEKSSKIVHYVLAAAAAGVALVVFTKPEKLVKFVSSISEFFGKGGPSKA
ncbi:MAG: hypothetical protein ACK5QX_08400 [bacterium]|jgi:hypothetical protein